jgi:hypothetical protein
MQYLFDMGHPATEGLSEQCFMLGPPHSYIRKANRTAGVSYWKSSEQNRRRQEEAVQDGERTVSRCGCGTETVREPR